MLPGERAALGRTDVTVTRLGLGTAPIGGMYQEVTEADALATIEAAWDAGVRFFDTAPLYGYGMAERRLGQVLRTHGRDDFVVSNKVGRVLRADVEPNPAEIFHGTPAVRPTFDFTYDGVMRSFESSLDRLGLDRVDVLMIHDPDEQFDAAMAGAYRALFDLRSQGVIKALGAGMNQWEMLARFAREGDFDCFLLAGRYTLLDQSGLDELLPICLEGGIGVIAGGVFNSGILADPRSGSRYNYSPAEAGILGRAQRLQEICRRHAVPLKAAALQFPLAHPAVISVVTGCRTAAEVAENASLFRQSVPGDLWAELRAERLLPEKAPTP